MSSKLKGVLAAALLGLLALAPGCGTLYQGHQMTGPAILGGIRLDIEQFGHEDSGIGDKIFYCIDLPFSLAGDVCFIGFFFFPVINELVAGGIDVEPQRPSTLDEPRGIAKAQTDHDSVVLVDGALTH